jgi:Na+/melibiose symporter-like transporter
MAGMIYFVKHVMHMPETAMGIIFPIFLGTAVLCIPLWVKVGMKLGKIRAYRIGLGFLTLMLFLIFFTKPGQTGLFYLQVFLLGIGFSSFQLFPFSMLPDTIEYDEMQSGMRREGVFSGSWAAGQKIAYSVGPGIVGFALSLSGFVAAGEQPESVSLGIRIVFCLLPASMMLLSFVPFHKYDLTEERFEDIKNKIRVSR